MKVKIYLEEEEIEDLIFSNRMSVMKPIIAEIARQYTVAIVRRTRSAICLNEKKEEMNNTR